MNVVGIIQARMGSSRLPGKVLRPIEGYPLLGHVIDRCRASRHMDCLAIATTRQEQDDAIVEFARGLSGVVVSRGSTDDVLERYFHCARETGADVIVRITADDPLKDAEIIDRAVDALLEDPDLDYCSNTLKPSFPEGFDIEAFRMGALREAHEQAELASEREHVTPFIWKNTRRFNVRNFAHTEDLSSWRLTVDKPQDLELIQLIYARLSGEGQWERGNLFSWEQVIGLLKEHPEYLEINKGTVRNEGYLRSIGEERS